MTVKERLVDYLANNHATQSYVARGIGKSAAAISTYLSDEGYKGDEAALEYELEAWLNLQDAKKANAASNFTFGFIKELPHTRSVYEVCRMCQLDGDIGVLVGEAGLGKTSSLKAYAGDNANVVLIEIDPTYTKRVLLEEIAAAVGARPAGNTLNALNKAIIATLQERSGTLIIIDECEYATEAQLELIRRIYDKSANNDGEHCGIILSGLPRLLSNLKGKGGQFKQMYSRVSVTKELKPLSTGAINRLTGFGDSLSKYVGQRTNGNIRMIRQLAKRVHRMQQIPDNVGIAVDKAFIEAALESLIF
jgi:DNA transposition AAA+ family ATPase